MRNSHSWETRKWSRPLHLPQPSALSKFLGCRAGRKNLAEYTSGRDEAESAGGQGSKSPQPSTRQEKALSRKSTEESAEGRPWGASRMLINVAGEGSAQGWGKDSVKRLQVTMPGGHTGPGPPPVLTNSSTLGEVPKGHPSAVGNNLPRSYTMLVPPNKS